ncbi:uncharacterized protein LOC144158985 isoform X2 [Haemaphysalis longicornis]
MSSQTGSHVVGECHAAVPQACFTREATLVPGPAPPLLDSKTGFKRWWAVSYTPKGRKPCPIKNQGKKLHHCRFCPYTSCRASNVVMHERVHTGEKPYRCSICPSAFTQRPSLKAHMRKHTGERPYVCSVCSSAFRWKHQLRKHVAEH